MELDQDPVCCLLEAFLLTCNKDTVLILCNALLVLCIPILNATHFENNLHIRPDLSPVLNVPDLHPRSSSPGEIRLLVGKCPVPMCHVQKVTDTGQDSRTLLHVG